MTTMPTEPRSPSSRLFGSILIASGLCCALVVVLSLSRGSLNVSFLSEFLLGTEQTFGDGASLILSIRGPRTLAAVAIGGSLAVSGILLQAIVRNPLAEPGLMGINSGAALFAVAAGLGLIPFLGAELVPLAAVVGGLSAALIVYIVSWKDGTDTSRLILAGIGVGAFCSGFISLITLFAEPQAIQLALSWLSGSLAGVSTGGAASALVATIIGVSITYIASRPLDVLRFDRDTIVGLGIPLERTRLVMTALAVILASIATAIGGVIAFVGLIAPHAARLLVGREHRFFVPVAVTLGAALVTAADLVGRIMIAPAQIPAGVVVSLLGAPYFLFLLIRSIKARNGYGVG